MDNLNRTYRGTRKVRHAMTLVELLVVVLLLGIVMGIAATAVKNGTKGKKLREASRQVNAFIAGAQSRAIEIGRPVGIEIIRNKNEPRAGLEIFMTETPAPYAGDTHAARFRIGTRGPLLDNSTTPTPPSPGYPGRYYTLEDRNGQSASMSFLLKNGDLIQLNFRGDWYKISNLTSNSFRIFVPDVDNNFNYKHTIPAQGSNPEIPGDFVRYKVQRQPLRSAVNALQMPSDTCIDLAFSGIGIGGQQYHPLEKTAATRVGFTFNSRGGIDRINGFDIAWNGNNRDHDNNNILKTNRADVLPTGSVYLLIGRYDGLVSMAEVEASEHSTDFYFSNYLGPNKDSSRRNKISELLVAEANGKLEDPSNLSNLNSIWVSVNHLTGKITTANNASIDTSSGTDNDDLLASARRLSKEAYSITGRGGQ